MIRFLTGTRIKNQCWFLLSPLTPHCGHSGDGMLHFGFGSSLLRIPCWAEPWHRLVVNLEVSGRTNDFWLRAVSSVGRVPTNAKAKLMISGQDFVIFFQVI